MRAWTTDGSHESIASAGGVRHISFTKIVEDSHRFSGEPRHRVLGGFSMMRMAFNASSFYFLTPFYSHEPRVERQSASLWCSAWCPEGSHDALSLFSLTEWSKVSNTTMQFFAVNWITSLHLIIPAVSRWSRVLVSYWRCLSSKRNHQGLHAASLRVQSSQRLRGDMWKREVTIMKSWRREHAGQSRGLRSGSFELPFWASVSLSEPCKWTSASLKHFFPWSLCSKLTDNKCLH